MHRNWLLKKLQNYQPELPTQKDLCERFIAFVTEYPDCFERSLLIGHITGSAWILNPDRQKTALIHHKKLHKWVQPGGHSDGDPNTLEVARREGCEETGLTALTEISDEIFDLDIHEIPARPTEPRHWHYDVRFAFCANGNLDLHVNEEVSELGWFDLNEILKSDLEESVIRLARKKKRNLPMSRLNEFKNNVNQSLFSGDKNFQNLLGSLVDEVKPLIGSLTRWEKNIPSWEALAMEASRPEKLPRVEKYDRVGNAIEDIRIALETAQVRTEVVSEGIFESSCELEKFARIYLLAQIGESGVTCPLACTDGLIRVVESLGEEKIKKEYLPLLRSREFPLAGAQFITEQAGGSDVGAIEGTAKPNADGSYALTAFKWYCSAFDEFFLMAARPEGDPEGTAGIAIFFVPRLIKSDDGLKVNSYSIRRLKNKLGTQSLPTAEIDFQGSKAYLLGRKEDGFHHLMTYVLNVSRVHNAANALGFHRRAFVEARNYAEQRMAFGKALIEFPLIQENLLDILAPLVCKRATYFSLVKKLDERGWLPENNDERLWQRFLINLMKYRTAVNLTEMVKGAILVLGANGIIEDFSILPRLLRDSLIVETWEGPHNTLCLQIMRDSRRFAFWEMFQKEINQTLDQWPSDTIPEARALFEKSLKRLMKISTTLNTPEAVQTHARRVVDEIAVLLESGCVFKNALKQKDDMALKLAQYYIEKNLGDLSHAFDATWLKWDGALKLKLIRGY